MTGFCMYQKVRFPRTQPRLSKRTHTGTGAGRVPLGTVQVMLVAVRLWGVTSGRRECGRFQRLTHSLQVLRPRPLPLPPGFFFPRSHAGLGCARLRHLPPPSFPHPPQAKKGPNKAYPEETYGGGHPPPSCRLWAWLT